MWRIYKKIYKHKLRQNKQSIKSHIKQTQLKQIAPQKHQHFKLRHEINKRSNLQPRPSIIQLRLLSAQHFERRFEQNQPKSQHFSRGTFLSIETTNNPNVTFSKKTAKNIQIRTDTLTSSYPKERSLPKLRYPLSHLTSSPP